VKRLFPQKLKAAEVTKTDIAASMQSAAKLLKTGKDVGRLQVRLLGEGTADRAFTFDVLGGECRVKEGASDDQDLELVLSEDTWVAIANGELSPVDAYLTGRMELAGDIDFAKRQYAKVRSRGGTEELPL
jgi:putative sterol carrier protein